MATVNTSLSGLGAYVAMLEEIQCVYSVSEVCGLAMCPQSLWLALNRH